MVLGGFVFGINCQLEAHQFHRHLDWFAGQGGRRSQLLLLVAQIVLGAVAAVLGLGQEGQLLWA